MVNENSLVHRFSEKVGLVIGKTIKYTIVGAIAVFIGEKLGGSTPSQPALAPPAPLP